MLKLRGAVLEIREPRKISEKFTVQELLLDTSQYNNMTGEKYENANLFQVINNKVDLGAFNRGDVVDVKFYLNGRFYDKKDGGKGFMQSLNLASIDRSYNTANEAIVFPEDQLIQTS